MKRDRLPEILDCMALGLNYTEIARRLAIDPKTIFNWMARSKAGDPKFIVNWSGVEAQFAAHARSAVRMSVMMIEAQARDFALRGFEEPVVYQGEVQYQRDPELVGRPDLVELLGLPDDYLRVDGRVQIQTVTRKPSDALVTLMLRSHLKTYADKASVDVNVGGVLRLQRPDERSAPKVIEHQSADTFSLEDDDSEQAPRGQLALGRPARDSAELDKWNRDGEFAPQPVAFVDAEGNRTERIAAPDPLLPLTGDKPLTPLQRDLLAKAAAGVKQPRPSAVVQVGKPSDESPAPKQATAPYKSDGEKREGIGAGPDPAMRGGARGVKVC
jgi:hypothetical protein